MRVRVRRTARIIDEYEYASPASTEADWPGKAFSHADGVPFHSHDTNSCRSEIH